MDKAVREEKQKLAKKYFRNHCSVCYRKFGKGFALHHREYDGTEPHYLDPNYYNVVFAQIRKRPRQFLLLCGPDHQAVTRLLRYGSERFERLVRAVRLSRK